MKSRPENYEALFTYRMLQWLQLAIGAVDKYDRSRARRNYLRLIPRGHQRLAAVYGFKPQNLN